MALRSCSIENTTCLAHDFAQCMIAAVDKAIKALGTRMSTNMIRYETDIA
jgi:hypothetical protein